MSDEKLSDRDAFNIFVRAGQRRNKIDWTPTGDPADNDALNRALRRAGGRDAPEPGGEPHPWKSLQDAGKRDSGDTR
jgi:hypothetical protein